MPFLRLHRGEADSPISQLEFKIFAFVKASLGWLGITVSPFCAEIISRVHQLAPTGHVHDCCAQTCNLRKLSSIMVSCLFLDTEITVPYKVSIDVFSDAGRSADKSQLCYTARLFKNGMRGGDLPPTVMVMTQELSPIKIHSLV